MPRKVDGRFRAKVEELWQEGARSPADIQKRIDEDAALAELEPPSPRWLQREVARLKNEDTSGPWALADASDATAADTLSTLRAVIIATEGQLTTISKAEARWLSRVRHAAPDLAPIAVFRLAQEYARRAVRDVPTNDLDVLLAFRPWAGAEHRKAHRDALNLDAVPFDQRIADYGREVGRFPAEWSDAKGWGLVLMELASLVGIDQLEAGRQENHDG